MKVNTTEFYIMKSKAAIDMDEMEDIKAILLGELSEDQFCFVIEPTPESKYCSFTLGVYVLGVNEKEIKKNYEVIKRVFSDHSIETSEKQTYLLYQEEHFFAELGNN